MVRFNHMDGTAREVPQLPFLDGVLLGVHGTFNTSFPNINFNVFPGKTIPGTRRHAFTVYHNSLTLSQDIDQYILSVSGRQLVNRFPQRYICFSLLLLAPVRVYGLDTILNGSSLH